MAKVAIYGGNFDPPHLGHVLVITNVLNAGLVDEIVLIPAGDDRYDKELYASSEHRTKMLEIIISESFSSFPLSIDMSQVDGSLPQGSRAIDLIRNFKSKRKIEELYFVIGSDNIQHLTSWANFDDLLNEVKFISVPRSGFEIENVPKYICQLKDNVVPINNFSSSKIRQMILANKCLAGILPDGVVNYINKTGIYK